MQYCLSDNGAKVMEFNSFDGGEDGEWKDLGLGQMFDIYARQDEDFVETRTFERFYKQRSESGCGCLCESAVPDVLVLSIN